MYIFSIMVIVQLTPAQQILMHRITGALALQGFPGWMQCFSGNGKLNGTLLSQDSGFPAKKAKGLLSAHMVSICRKGEKYA